MATRSRDPSERRLHKRDDLVLRKSAMLVGNVCPTLEELCVRNAIDNLDRIRDVGHTDTRLLRTILPHCTAEQLLKIEETTTERDLSPVTNELWLKHYSRKFGEENFKTVKDRMKKTNKIFKWKALYQAKLREQDDVEKKCVERLKELYKESTEKKDSRRLQQIELMPPPSRKRTLGSTGGGGSSARFGGGGSSARFGGGGSSTRVGKPSETATKGRLMKKQEWSLLPAIKQKNSPKSESPLQVEGDKGVLLGRWSDSTHHWLDL